MALNSIVKTANSEAQAVELSKLETQTPAAKPAIAPSPITADQANALASALRPGAGLSNPVAEVQAKLRAAMQAVPPQPSRLQDTAFMTLMIAACALMVVLGVALGIACVLFGAAMFLFPVSAGLALGGFVVASGALFYFIYTHGVKQKTAKAGETLEPLAAGRLSAAWGL